MSSFRLAVFAVMFLTISACRKDEDPNYKQVCKVSNRAFSAGGSGSSTRIIYRPDGRAFSITHYRPSDTTESTLSHSEDGDSVIISRPGSYDLLVLNAARLPVAHYHHYYYLVPNGVTETRYTYEGGQVVKSERTTTSYGIPVQTHPTRITTYEWREGDMIRSSQEDGTGGLFEVSYEYYTDMPVAVSDPLLLMSNIDAGLSPVRNRHLVKRRTIPDYESVSYVYEFDSEGRATKAFSDNERGGAGMYTIEYTCH